MVFAGGGFRFGIYLGMYAAARDAGRAPDLLLATCGGAIAATIIQALPDDAQRLAWLSSPEMYRFWGSLQAARQASLLRTLARAARQGFSRARAPVIPDLFNDYLFDVPPQLPLPVASAQPGLAVATIGGKLLFGPADAGQARAGRKLFVQTVLCEARAAALVQGMASPFASAVWGDHAIANEVLTRTDIPQRDAARLSITDFYYFPCHRQGDEHYIGGVLDLFPIELAHRLADEVMIEFKESFDQTFSIPAWRAVLGLDGNQRLRHVNAQKADVWFDSSDISRALPTQQVHKKIDWPHKRITLALPDSHATYVSDMAAQWQYGYQRAQEALKKSARASNKSHIRNVNRYNRAAAATQNTSDTPNQ